MKGGFKSRQGSGLWGSWSGTVLASLIPGQPSRAMRYWFSWSADNDPVWPQLAGWILLIFNGLVRDPCLKVCIPASSWRAANVVKGVQSQAWLLWFWFKSMHQPPTSDTATDPSSLPSNMYHRTPRFRWFYILWFGQIFSIYFTLGLPSNFTLLGSSPNVTPIRFITFIARLLLRWTHDRQSIEASSVVSHADTDQAQIWLALCRLLYKIPSVYTLAYTSANPTLALGKE